MKMTPFDHIRALSRERVSEISKMVKGQHRNNYGLFRLSNKEIARIISTKSNRVSKIVTRKNRHLETDVRAMLYRIFTAGC